MNLRYLAVGAVLAVIAAAASVAGWLQGDETAVKPATRAADAAWNPPSPAAADLAAYEAMLAKKPPFGTSPAPGTAAPGAGGPGAPGAPGAPGGPGAAGGTAAAAVATPWRVSGIVTTADNRSLVLMIGKPGDKMLKSELRRAGESLPDGSIVRDIEPGSVTLDRDGNPVTIKMFVRN